MTASRASAARIASTRRRSSSLVPTAAPNRRRPLPSTLLAALLGARCSSKNTAFVASLSCKQLALRERSYWRRASAFAEVSRFMASNMMCPGYRDHMNSRCASSSARINCDLSMRKIAIATAEQWGYHPVLTSSPLELTTGRSFRLLFFSCSSACSKDAVSGAISKSLHRGRVSSAWTLVPCSHDAHCEPRAYQMFNLPVT